MDKKLKILVVGGGGREHALAWKLAQSPWTEKIYCAPGNGGIFQLAECVGIAADDIRGLLKFAKAQKIDFTIVGPEGPLAAGIADIFKRHRLAIFGPSKKAAVLEASKVFAKRLMQKYAIPTADFKVFTKVSEAKAHLKKASYPIVVKADGLAAGKGVVIAKNQAEAFAAVERIMKEKIFGKAGSRVVIEECLTGPEISVLAFTDGKNVLVLPSAQDHKRIFDQDQGPNTGGMGAYCPAPLMDETMLERVKTEILKKTVEAMRKEKRPFQGVLYAGLMLTDQGPKVLEFNVRFGDPETQAILPCLASDLLEILWACAKGSVQGLEIRPGPDAAVCVVMAAEGYPGEYKTGEAILGLEQAQKIPGVTVFHAGTRRENGVVKTAGGRVLGVTALGCTLREAVSRAYQAVDLVSFRGAQFRRDIAQRALDLVHS